MAGTQVARDFVGGGGGFRNHGRFEHPLGYVTRRQDGAQARDALLGEEFFSAKLSPVKSLLCAMVALPSWGEN